MAGLGTLYITDATLLGVYCHPFLGLWGTCGLYLAHGKWMWSKRVYGKRYKVHDIRMGHEHDAEREARLVGRSHYLGFCSRKIVTGSLERVSYA